MSGGHPIEDYVFAGITKTFEATFKVASKVTLRENLDDVFRQVADPSERKGAICALRPTLMEVLEGTDTRSLAGALRPGVLYRGAAAGASTTVAGPEGPVPSVQHVVRPLPAKFSFTVFYGTTDYTELRRFFTTWTFARQYNRLDFNLSYLNLSYPVKAILSPSVSVPQKAPTADNAGYLVYEGELEVMGWVTNINDPRDRYDVPTVLDTEITIEVDFDLEA